MDIERVLNIYGDMLYRLCFVMLGSAADSEDAVQEVLLKYWRKAPALTDAQHEKAWLLKVTINQCRDILRFRSRRSQISLEELQIAAPEAEDHGIIEALMQLPEKYRLLMTLHYVEDYSVIQIAEIIGRTPSAVKMRLQKGRELLKTLYRKEFL